MTRRLVVPIACAFCICAIPASAYEDSGWVTSDAYAALFKKQKKRGHFSTVLVGRLIEGQKHYRAYFEKRPKDFGFKALRGMDAAKLARYETQFQGEGYRPLWKQSFKDSGDVIHQAVWVRGRNPITHCIEAGKHWYREGCHADPVNLLATEPAEPALPTWTAAELDLATANCTRAVMEPALADFKKRAAAEGNANAEFPTGRVEPFVRDTCDCLFEQISARWDFAEFAADQTVSKTLAEDAWSGQGPCRPSGLLGKVAGQQRQ